MAFRKVTIIDSPITARYVPPGSEGELDEINQQIRVGGAWFDFNPERWKIVTDKEKKEHFLKAVTKSVILDYEFNQLIEAYAITEEEAFEWMVETKKFIRDQLKGGWYLKER